MHLKVSLVSNIEPKSVKEIIKDNFIVTLFVITLRKSSNEFSL